MGFGILGLQWVAYFETEGRVEVEMKRLVDCCTEDTLL
jgi:hypothetical protein